MGTFEKENVADVSYVIHSVLGLSDEKESRDLLVSLHDHIKKSSSDTSDSLGAQLQQGLQDKSDGNDSLEPPYINPKLQSLIDRLKSRKNSHISKE